MYLKLRCSYLFRCSRRHRQRHPSRALSPPPPLSLSLCAWKFRWSSLSAYWIIINLLFLSYHTLRQLPSANSSYFLYAILCNLFPLLSLPHFVSLSKFQIHLDYGTKSNFERTRKYNSIAWQAIKFMSYICIYVVRCMWVCIAIIIVLLTRLMSVIIFIVFPWNALLYLISNWKWHWIVGCDLSISLEDSHTNDK